MFDTNRVADLDFGGMGDEELIGALRAVHGVAAAAQAAEVRAVRELYRRHRAGSAQPGPGGVRAGEFAAGEAAVALQSDEGTAAALIDVALVLEESLPRTRAAFAAGRIDLAKVRVIVDSTRGLGAELVEVLEPRLLEAAGRTNPARLRQAARRWALRLDPQGAQRRREERQEERDVRIRAVQDGMAVFDGLLPAPGAQTVAMRLREMSLQVCAQDPRTMAQRRADALVALADGSGQLRCGCGRADRCPARSPVAPPRRPLIQIGIPADSLLGMQEAPAFLAGYGPIDAALARLLAEHARFEMIPERIAASAREVRAVDGMCRFPGCVLPAAECEVDGKPGRAASAAECEMDGRPGRAASGAGLIVLCSRHHRLKSLADIKKQPWRIVHEDGDSLRWTAPTGAAHTTVREGARYLFPHTDTDAPAPITPSSPPEAPRSPVDRPTPEELAYPVAGHFPLHGRLRGIAPEDDIPEQS
ncbi:DUF222 domain-containing protein [Nocardia sp. NPDC048505]|uniref:DUF222 domain-containing protein n=1 Tax=unclassified Nocardia TaxID=2637762 RepID=UPI0033E17D58